MLKLWFGDSYLKEFFSFRYLVGILDNRFKEIFLIMEIKRMFRLVFEYFKYWKVSELRLFLLFYGVFILYGIFFEDIF